jgi:hypothetical protein
MDRIARQRTLVARLAREAAAARSVLRAAIEAHRVARQELERLVDEARVTGGDDVHLPAPEMGSGHTAKGS